MNARQKAKKLKKELDFYKNMPVPTVKVYNTDVKTYIAKRTVATRHLNEMSINEESPLTYIKNEIIHELAKAISNDVEFTSVPSILLFNTDIMGEITIATRR